MRGKACMKVLLVFIAVFVWAMYLGSSRTEDQMQFACDKATTIYLNHKPYSCAPAGSPAEDRPTAAKRTVV